MKSIIKEGVHPTLTIHRPCFTTFSLKLCHVISSTNNTTDQVLMLYVFNMKLAAYFILTGLHTMCAHIL